MQLETLSTDRLLSRVEVETLFGISKRFLEIAALRGDGPPMVKIGKRMVRYRVADLRAWLAARTVRHTSETPANDAPAKGASEVNA